MNELRRSATSGCTGRRPVPMTRREMLACSANGFGLLALCGLMTESAASAERRIVRQTVPHFAPRAKNVIFCFMDGGVSHVDSFDPKAKLDELDGQPFNDSKNPTADGQRQWLKSPWAFRQHGDSGLPVSELFPCLSRCVDDLAVIRSMKADLPIHSTGVLFLHTGSNNAGRPSLGSWVNYGLGSQNQNLPGFVVLSFGVVPCGGLETFSSGFLPANHQATLLQADGTPIDNILPADKDPRIQEAKLALIARAKSCVLAFAGRPRRRRVGDHELRNGLSNAVPCSRRTRPGTRNRSDPKALRHRFKTPLSATLWHPMLAHGG